ncbi:MAG: molybdate ABC transporter substrate-binding protein [Verrucomicrobiales bacterium]|jgi:molybdate transport system substrate-binding protein|nr:molybdate ABC transporter substrate-binding protein [Verrucomicrobiales bacterium]
MKNKNQLKHLLYGCLLAAGLLVLAMSSQSPAAELKVFGAASLTDVLKELSVDYEKETGNKTIFSMGASSAVALQIQQGAPADLFFSADEAKMDALEKAGLILKDTRVSLLSNTLVVVAPADSKLTLHSIDELAEPKIKKLALAEPQTVPVGVYAKAYLQKKGLWDRIAVKMIPTQNVRASLGAVEGGDVDAGIVYKTDAVISKKVKIIYEVSAAEGPKISYPVAVVGASKSPGVAQALIAYYQTPHSKAVFEKYGFLILSTGR